MGEIIQEARGASVGGGMSLVFKSAEHGISSHSHPHCFAPIWPESFENKQCFFIRFENRCVFDPGIFSLLKQSKCYPMNDIAPQAKFFGCIFLFQSIFDEITAKKHT